MGYNVVKIGYLDCCHVETKPVDQEQMAKSEHVGSVWFESAGSTGGDGVFVYVDYGDLKADDRSEAVAQFVIPPYAWKDFVAAVNAIDSMWDRDSD